MRGLVVVTVALLAGCASRPVPLAIAPTPIPAPVLVEAAPAPTPTNAGLSAAGTLWHLRAGLNVAALACRATDLTAGYNAMLARDAGRLKEAEAGYAAEYQARGGNWRKAYDDEMTRLYNFWGQARGRDALCAAAGTALADPAVADDAAARLAALDRGFAPPWMRVDPAVLGAAPVQVAVR